MQRVEMKNSNLEFSHYWAQAIRTDKKLKRQIYETKTETKTAN